MKKIYLLITGVFLAFNASAQLKNVLPTDRQAVSETIIKVPQNKKVATDDGRTSRIFAPQSLTYRQISQNGLKVTSFSQENLPLFIEGEPQLKLRDLSTPEGLGYNFLENAQELMKIQEPSQEFVPVYTVIDDLGMMHVKFHQLYKNVPVYGAEVIYHKGEKSQFLNGRYVETPTVEEVTPTISKAEVENITERAAGGLMSISDDQLKLFDFEQIESNLVIYQGQLAYHITVYKDLIDRWEYFVDAHSGDILQQHESLCKFHNHKNSGMCSHVHSDESNDHAPMKGQMPPPDGPVVSNAVDLFGSTKQINTYQSGGKYYLIDAARTMYDAQNSNIPDDPVGAIWTIDAFETSPQNTDFKYDHVSSTNVNFSGKNTGVSAQFNGGKAYEYFKNVHGRNSINGQGGNVIGLINIADKDGSSLGNAFWNGVAMFYGNGDNSFLPLARGLDVAGHEMSHGVVQKTANLEYQGESGALNESFADIFGAMIDRDDWVIGEDVVRTSAFPSGALRSLQDPHNGAQTGNFNRGWQPRVYSERFQGSQDNGGVHINSGIPNYAFYLFATANGVGKAKAEKVYYRALTTYLTKSSQFIDARLGVVKAAQDLYGSSVANAAKAAFDAVEIFNGNPTDNQTNVEVNPGQDLIMFTSEDQNNLYIADAAGNLIFNPLTEENPISVPSISDDGTEIIFVNQDKELYYIQIDWATKTKVQDGVLSSNEKWRNAVFSRDGMRMAALRDTRDNTVFVYDFESSTGKDFTLFNPTFTEGVNTGDVLYADALEFDFNGKFLMYDAFNRIQSSSGGKIEYWDIGFINVFNPGAGTFTDGKDLQKLFSQLPDGVSIGNPTFSKNSDYIVAFDYLKDGKFTILGSNIEVNKTGEIYDDNGKPGYPDYSRNDDKVIFDATSSNKSVIGGATLKNNKIESTNAEIQLGYDVGVRWGVWFSNGQRDLSSTKDLDAESVFRVYPNPVSDFVTIVPSDNVEVSEIIITNLLGQRIVHTNFQTYESEKTIEMSSYPSGTYIVTIKSAQGEASKLLIKK